MKHNAVKYTYVGIRLNPEEVKTLKRVQKELKRRTVTDTLRFLILKEGDAFCAQK